MCLFDLTIKLLCGHHLIIDGDNQKQRCEKDGVTGNFIYRKSFEVKSKKQHKHLNEGYFDTLLAFLTISRRSSLAVSMFARKTKSLGLEC